MYLICERGAQIASLGELRTDISTEKLRLSCEYPQFGAEKDASRIETECLRCAKRMVRYVKTAVNEETEPEIARSSDSS